MAKVKKQTKVVELTDDSVTRTTVDNTTSEPSQPIVDPMDELVVHPLMVLQMEPDSKFKLEFEMDRNSYEVLYVLYNKLIILNMSVNDKELKDQTDFLFEMLTFFAKRLAATEVIKPMKRGDFIAMMKQIQEEAQRELEKKAKEQAKEQSKPKIEIIK